MAGNSGPNIITDNLILHLDAANTQSYSGVGTTWNDLTSNNLNATLSNVNYDNGNSGCFSFGGVNSIATIPDTSLLSFTNNIFTFDYWVYFNNTSSVNGIIGKGEGSWEYAIYGQGNSTNSVVFYSWPVSGNGPVYYIGVGQNPSSTTFAAGLWYHHCWTTDGTNSFVYINSILSITNSKNSLYNMGNGTSRFTIGAAGDSGGLKYLNGKLGPIKIYNKTLSSTEVLQNYNATKSRFGLS